MVEKRYLIHYSEPTDVLCPYCGKDRMCVRDHTLIYNNPGKVIRFAVCDNEECNVEWFAHNTEDIRNENAKNRDSSSGENTKGVKTE